MVTYKIYLLSFFLVSSLAACSGEDISSNGQIELHAIDNGFLDENKIYNAFKIEWAAESPPIDPNGSTCKRRGVSKYSFADAGGNTLFNCQTRDGDIIDTFNDKNIRLDTEMNTEFATTLKDLSKLSFVNYYSEDSVSLNIQPLTVTLISNTTQVIFNVDATPKNFAPESVKKLLQLSFVVGYLEGSDYSP